MIFLKIVLGIPLFLFLGWGGLYTLARLAYPVSRCLTALEEFTKTPRCPSCRWPTLKRYDLPFADAQEVRRYRCRQCHMQFKRSLDDVWTQRPGKPDDIEEMFALHRPVSMMGYKSGQSDGDLLGSWYGCIYAGLPGEAWPEYDGIPMLPLCQLRCAEMPYRPPAFEGIALVCVFVASVGAEVVSPQGEQWVLRTYKSLEDLVPISYPGDTTDIRSYRVAWHAAEDHPYSIYSLPEELWMDYYHCCEREGRFFWPYKSHEPRMYQRGSKAGGYPLVSEPMTQIREGVAADFVFQIDTVGNFPWLRGPGGSLLFQRSSANEIDTWHVNHRSLEMIGGQRVRSLHLGFEREGLQIYVRSIHGSCDLMMAYRGRVGRLRRINDLRGLVRITTLEMALRFVRLPEYAGLTRSREYEIFTQEQYALRAKGNPLVREGMDWIRQWEGRIALEPEALAQLGMSSAQVEAIEDGFRVTRWLCIQDYVSQPVFRQIAETVQTDGTYTRRILFERPVTAAEEQETGDAG